MGFYGELLGRHHFAFSREYSLPDSMISLGLQVKLFSQWPDT